MLAALALGAALAFPADVIVRAEDATVIVHAATTAYGPDGLAGPTRAQDDLCSGVVVAARGTRVTIATARHCDEPDPATGEIASHVVRVTFFDGDVGRAIGSRHAENDDLALVDVVTMRRHTAIGRAGAPPARGARLFVFGAPIERFWSLSSAVAMQGPTASHESPIWDRTFFVESASVRGGDSGAGVWDCAGDLVGILVGSDNKGTTLVEPIALLRGIK